MNIILLGANVQKKGTRCHIGRKELIKMIVNKGHSLKVLGNVPQTMCDPIFAKIGASYKQIKLSHSISNPIQQLKGIYTFVNLFNKYKPAMFIVYSVQRIPSTIIAAKLSKVKKVNVVINGSGRLFQYGGAKGRILRFVILPIIRYCLKSCEHVFFQNKDDRQMFIEMNLIDEDKAVHVNGSGVNTTDFEVKSFPKQTTFLMVGRLLKEKGVMEYLEAAKTVKSKYPETKFILAGPLDSSESGVRKEMIDTYHNDQVVEYVGEVQNIKDFYEKCSVFVLPSYYREGIPRTILEAMSVGRPVITTNSPGCKETVNDGVNGFLIPPKDKEALTEKMLWMIENCESIEKMGQNSREICEEKYDVIKVNQTMLKEMGLLEGSSL